MTCFHPAHGFRGPDGKFVAARKDSPTQVPMVVPCGRCDGCKAARAASWAVRISHEASLRPDNAFVTLTYNDQFLPDDYSVSVREVQLFMKRLRKSIEPIRVRYFAVGEYGETSLRPHYHIIIFGYSFPDRQLWRVNTRSDPCYRSEHLERLWTKGNSEFGTVTAASGGYVARYSLKKVGGGPGAAKYYERVNPLTGEIVQCTPEFAVMSTHPGIGGDWFDQFEGDAFPSDFLVLDGKKVPVPKYYQRKLRGRYENGGDINALSVQDDLAPVLRKRVSEARERASDSTPERLAVREEILQRRLDRAVREL